ncbi:MAG TPA: glycosyltransferase family 4 protein [Gaiellaceae bacterium]|nr:glycosyltransferase family 4 protein [Gaiellaceae bacterium]
MPTRVVVLSEIPTPYRLPLYEMLAARPELELEVLFCSREQPDRPWDLDEQLARVPHRFLPGMGLRFGGRRNTFVYEVNPTIVRELSRRRPDVLVIGGYAVFAEQAAIAYARARRVPYVLHTESQMLKQRPRLKRAVKWALLPPIVRNAAAALAVGSAAARYLEHYGLARDRIRIFPNTIDVSRYRTAAENARAHGGSGERYWLYAGRLVEDKGLTELIAALRSLGEHPPLLVAGEGPLAAKLAQVSGVRMLGFRPTDELIELMACAELTIVPSRNEPWGVVVNEALAAGSPVVVGDKVGATEDLVIDGVNGRVFASGDASALTRALSQPPPAGARDRGPIDSWDYAFGVAQFLEAIEIALQRNRSRKSSASAATFVSRS